MSDPTPAPLPWWKAMIPTQYRLTAAEIFWAAVVAIGLELLQVLATFQPEKVTDYRTWAISLAGSLIRVGAAAAIAKWPRSQP